MVVAERPPPTSLLVETASVGARTLALRYLDEASAAAKRLSTGGDPEALHDFRVGLRRLRSLLKNYRNELAPVAGRKWRKLLGGIAGLTNEGRDSEVQLTWLDGQRLRTQVRGFRWVRRQVEDRMLEAYAEVQEDVLREFTSAEGRLRQRFRHLPLVEGENSFGSRTGELLERGVQQLWGLTTEIFSPTSELAIHDARIAGKRLRYLLEGVQQELRSARKFVKALKRLQDSLGDIHDAQVMQLQLRRLRVRATLPVTVAGRVKAIDELARRAEDRKYQRYNDFEIQWRNGEGEKTLEGLRRLAQTLRS